MRKIKIPQLSDLRESGSLEQDSDIVMFIHRKDEEEEIKSDNVLSDLIIAKHRNGPTKTIQLLFQGNLAKFDNYYCDPSEKTR